MLPKHVLRSPIILLTQFVYSCPCQCLQTCACAFVYEIACGCVYVCLFLLSVIDGLTISSCVPAAISNCLLENIAVARWPAKRSGRRARRARRAA